MNEPSFLPFYDRLASRVPGGEVVVSAVPGLAFLFVHSLSIKGQVFKDWSWFLAALISVAMLCLYYATHTLRAMLPEMDVRLRPDGGEAYLTPLTRILSDRNFVLAGLVFGALNCLVGVAFGLPYPKGLAVVTILIGYFLAGWVCGMAVLGIYGVSVSVSAFSRKAKPAFDFTSPDRCGGTLFLGEGLVVFASVTLIVGVMISVYVLETPWTRGATSSVMMLKGLWLVFPYCMSLVALIGPAVPLNRALREYKLEQEVLIQDRLAKIRERLDEGSLDAGARKAVREDYEFQQSSRRELHTMRTWPYGLGANLTYLTVFVANAFASLKSASSWIEHYFPPAP